MSPFAYRSRRALQSRIPSMIEAWLSASEITASSSPSSASNRPPFASKHDEKRIVSSVPRKVESRCSSSRCSSCVPQMKRTDAIPYPHRSSASCAASTTAGWFASPR